MRDLLSRLELDTVVPLRSGESSHGALLLGARAAGKSLAEEDRDFLRSLASQAAAAFDNLRLTREWVEKQKIEKEMALAREIQSRLLPPASKAGISPASIFLVSRSTATTSTMFRAAMTDTGS